jgi:hypothetical protein
MGKLLEQRNRALDDINAGRTVKKIRDLESRVRELEEYNARLQALMDFDNERLDQIENELEEVEYLGPYVEGIKVLKKQLAASQLHAEQLRMALESCYEKMKQMCLNGEWYAPDKAIDLAYTALALPRDTSALDAYVAEKVKEYQERLADALAILGADSQIEAEAVMLNYKKQVSTLNRQRDLAVEAIRHCIAAMGSVTDVKKAMDWPQLHNAQMLSLQALDAIKESEGK